MKDIDADIISRIQKLLNMSDTKRGTSIDEAKTALEMAHKLLAKHHLSMSQIMALDESGSANSGFFELTEQEAYTYVANELPKWLKNLIEVVNLITETRTLIKRSPIPGKTYGTLRIVYIGDVVDVTSATDLLQFLKETVSGLSNTHAKKHDNKFKYWRSFAEGCSNALLEKAERLISKNKLDKDLTVENSADRLSVDNFEIDEDDEVIDDEENIDEDDDSEIKVTEQSLELYKKYQDTKFEKIKEFISSQNIEEERSSSRSSKVDDNSFIIGQRAAEKIPLKVMNKLSTSKVNHKKQRK